METFSALLALCEGNPLATGGFPSQRPVTPSFDAFFDPCLKKQLSKQSRHRWFESLSGSLSHITVMEACKFKLIFLYENICLLIQIGSPWKKKLIQTFRGWSFNVPRELGLWLTADALDPHVVRSSEAMVLVSKREDFLLPVPSQCWEMIENANMWLCFL